MSSAKIRITGGPSPADIKVETDGEPAQGVAGFRLEGDPTKALRMTTIQYVEADVEIEAIVEPEEWLCLIRTPEWDDRHVIKAWREQARGTGPDLRTAVMAAAQALPGKLS